MTLKGPDLPDLGDDSHFTLACPFCQKGTLDTQRGIAQHTPTHFRWVGLVCPTCGKSFTFDSGRSLTSS